MLLKAFDGTRMPALMAASLSALALGEPTVSLAGLLSGPSPNLNP